MRPVRILITGTSTGIGRATALLFLNRNHTVIGLDKDESTIDHPWYKHYKTNIDLFLPDIDDVDVLINNAGVQNTGHDIQTNLISLIKCTEKYGVQPNIKSIVNLASVSAHNGAEFPEYCASKGGVLAYTVNTAKRVAQWRATCNSLSFGGVLTDLNKPVIDDADKWNEIMNMTPLKKWATPEECAEWIYFFSVVNKSCTGQDLIIDNGETINHKFVW